MEAEAQKPEPEAKLLPCDLVMQGGITSGVVYPGAVINLSHKYHFVNVGGASAGAIAAAATAAAELGRQSGKDGFSHLEAAMRDLGQPGFLLGLFQPIPRARTAFNVLLKLVTSHAPGWRRMIDAVLTFVLTPWIGAIVFAAAVLLAYLALPLAHSLSGPSRWLLVFFVFMTWLLLTLGVAAVKFAYVLSRLMAALPSSGYGLCSGLRQPPSTQLGLTDWIYSKIQQCAGRTDTDPPVTFADLEAAGINLRLVTTDLSLGRPVKLPLAEDSGYLFTESGPDGLLPLVPDAIRKHLIENSTQQEIEGGIYRNVPGLKMPVALAARLSLSFPVLLSAMPLFELHPEVSKTPLRHWLSDGGITSNFPIHFFDAWLPGHPTFGLSLQPAGQHKLPESEMVDLGRSPDVPRWTNTNGIGDFASQIFDASRNWRDAMQAQLPGSRDRIASIYLFAEEGGLNLNMPVAIVNKLDSRGREAGQMIVDKFDWPRHQLTRYLTWMQMMQIGLHGARESYPEFRPILEAGNLDKLGADVAYDDPWCATARPATEELIALATALGGDDAGPLFNVPEAPHPTPVMRVVPDV